MRVKRIRALLSVTAMALILFSLIISGCAGKKGPKPLVDPDYKSAFDEKIDRLLTDILQKGKYKAAEVAPVTVMPGSLKSGLDFTRLEEVIIERLEQRLLETNELVVLSRNNWFEFREGRPLSFKFTKGYDPAVLRELIIYEVNISADAVLEEFRVKISAFNSSSRMVAGMTASTKLDYAPDRPGRMLHELPSQMDPFPEGLEENPYNSVDRLSFNLAGELADAYKTGVDTGDGLAADKEIKVLLYVKRQNGVEPALASSIGNRLQQAVITNRGFTCVVSQSDFGPVFEQVDFYKTYDQVFDLEESKFQTGTVFLMADIYPHQKGDKIGIALRALWRVNPLEDKSGAFISTQTAGTYLSGFTAKSYLTAKCNAGSDHSETSSPYVASPANINPVITDVPLETHTMCFYGFSNPMSQKIYPVISRMPGLQSIKRSDGSCDDAPGCIGYTLSCRCRTENLYAWIKDNLQQDKNVVPYRIDETAENTLSFYYNAGFE